MELDNCVTHSTLAGSIYHIFETKLQNHALNRIYELKFFIKIPVKCHLLFLLLINTVFQLLDNLKLICVKMFCFTILF